MKRLDLLKVLLAAGLLVGLAWSGSAVNLVKQIKGADAGFAGFYVDDIYTCADGTTAWMVGTNRADVTKLFKLDLAENKVVAQCELGKLYGPRGTPGMDLDPECTFAWVVNYPLDTVMKVDLATCEVVGEITVDPKPTDVSLAPALPPYTYLDYARNKLIVTNSFSDEVTIIDGEAMVIECIAPDVGFGPNSAKIAGQIYTETLPPLHPMAFVVNRYGDTMTLINLKNCGIVGTITGLGRVPEDLVFLARGGQYYRAYIPNYVGNSVSVVDIQEAALKVIKEIPVCLGPKYIEISPDGRFVFVSCAQELDKEVYIIETCTDEVVEKLDIIPAGEPAPVTELAVSGTKLYVLWVGGTAGRPADFVLYEYDYSQLYE